MPNLVLTGSDRSFSWLVTDLSNSFSTNSYIEVGITKYSFTVGGVTSISGVIDKVQPTSSNTTKTSTPVRSVDYEPGTYTFYAFAKSKGDAKYWPAGSATVVVTGSVVTRPTNWSWTSSIASGSAVSITAKEWNNFCTRINEFRTYKELHLYDFTTAVSGKTPISADICNQAWSAINDITGHGTMPGQAVKGGPLYASFFTGLRDALNAIS